ncbi:MAG: ArnT family glycosyltransferase [Gemmataceae bacterium]
MSAETPHNRLQRNDYLILVLFCTLLYGCTILNGRYLTGHEAVVPQSVREMLADHDWLIPKCGGLIWLERPPLAHWFVAAVVTGLGSDGDWAMRTAAMIMGTGIVCLVGWMSAIFLGRWLGLFSGLIFASMREFARYAVDPETDIFLCGVVTACMAVFLYLEFVRPVRDDDRLGFFGGRPWPVLLFFVLLGMTNLVKGLFFGTLMVAVPVGTFLLWSFDLKQIRRYLWFWGWLVGAAVWLSWPVAAWLQHPGILELWRSDYIGRLNGGYVAEPRYYYLFALPWVLLPWTLPALVGLWSVRAEAFQLRGSPARFLWAWGLSVPIFFSIPDGKHHHYLLHSMAPWAMLAALGSQRIWHWLLARPEWIRRLGWGALFSGVILAAVVYLVRGKLHGPDWYIPIFMATAALLMVVSWWACTRADARVALTSVFMIIVACYTIVNGYEARYHGSYLQENAFLTGCETIVPPGQPIYVNSDERFCLENFRVLFYLRERQPILLHNPTFLIDERIAGNEIYVMARMCDAPRLARYGQIEQLLVSDSFRQCTKPSDRRALYRLSYREDVVRKPIHVYVTAMQATRRAAGPDLE